MPKRPSAASGAAAGSVQAAAIPTAVFGRARLVLLVTSRGTGRWVPPKGWIGKGAAKGKGARGTAKIEAWEEAGVRGRMRRFPLGVYDSVKDAEANPSAAVGVCGASVCRTAAYLLEVDEIASIWPESGQRERRWVLPGEAASMVREPGLSALLEALASVPCVQTRRIRRKASAAKSRP